MYYNLVSALKRRLVIELKDIFSKHPIYEKVVPNIQTKYVFTERPQYGIVIKGSSANKVTLSGDNFMGIIASHVMLAYVNQPAYPIEWVREDSACIEKHQGMPIAPGIYYVEILSAPTTTEPEGEFMVDPLLTVTDEPLILFQSGIEREAQLQSVPMQGTVRIWENRRHPLEEGRDFEVNYTTGAVLFKTRFYPNTTITADYRYPVDSIGPVKFTWNHSDTSTLPGVVMAFGKRARAGDKVAVMVYPDRVDTAKAYGGKSELSFDIDVIAQDPLQMEEIADFTMVKLLEEKKPALEFEGIEILDVSIGGEAEEVYDETAENFVYTASMSVQLRADWEVHVPMPLTISHATTAPTSVPVDYDRRTTATSQIQESSNSSLMYATVPTILAGRNADYERIT